MTSCSCCRSISASFATSLHVADDVFTLLLTPLFVCVILIFPLQSFFAILLAGIGASQAQLAFPDIGKAKQAVINVFSLLDRNPTITSGPERPQIRGEIELRYVNFNYPTRPNVSHPVDPSCSCSLSFLLLFVVSLPP